MSEPVIIVRSGTQEVGRCDEACYNAISIRCTCCCGGINHGKGYDKALRNTRNMYRVQIRLNFPEAAEPLEVFFPERDPYLF